MRKIWLIFLLFISFISLSSFKFFGDPLDEILQYQIVVSPRKDGTLDMRYYIEWHVLDSVSEGPLTWVKIGVPNKYVDDIRGLSDPIEKIYYYTDSGAYIRIDLDRSYRKGEVVVLDFAFHQSRIFTVNDEFINYGFIPGWFDEIKVHHLEVLWNKENVIGNNSKGEKGDYLYWECSLDYGETTKIEVQYNQSSFPYIDLTKTYTDDDGDFSDEIIIAIIIIVVCVIIVVSIINSYNSRNNYYSYRGFSGRVYHRYYFFRRRPYRGYRRGGRRYSKPVVVSSGSSFRGGSSCACACACAGGGRAGCSRKDFYNPNLSVDDIVKEK